MEISGISSSSTYMPPTPNTGPIDVEAAEKSSRSKSLQTQDKIAGAVIKQVQDQQQVLANGLIGMMQNTIDILA